MCTVSYLPVTNGFILTSNRDETASRRTSPPVVRQVENQKLIFPKDNLANGTWIAVAKNGRVACLLNGAFGKHKRKLPYDKSRGLILLESFNSPSAKIFCEEVNLTNIEPFTLVLVDDTDLIELKWDGVKKHINLKDKNEAHLWSSSTLYNDEVATKKESWFYNWLQKFDSLEDKNVLSFHNTQHGKVVSEDVKSYFFDDLQTVSITQITVSELGIKMKYHDLMKEQVFEQSFNNLTNLD